MKDIANKVGVSTALVSYVLNGLEKEKRVSQEVVEKIHKVAKELNYKPNQIARSLRKGSTNTIGLIVADISNPFFGQLARVIEDEATNRNERRVELAGEGLKYFDILRWKIAEEVMNKQVVSFEIPDLLPLRIIHTRNFDPNKHYVWPIPQSAIDNAKNLEQHPEWR